MVARIDLVRAKLNRAEKHLDELQAMVCRYVSYDRDPLLAYANVPANAPNPPVKLIGDNWGWLGVGVVQWAVVTGDVVHNLRSSLDQIADGLVQANGGAPTEHTTFPILKVGPTPDRYGRSKPPHVSGGVSEAAADKIRSVQPYVTEPNVPRRSPLAQLHELSLVDKHRGLNVVVATITDCQSRANLAAGIPKGRFSRQATFDDGAEFVFVPDEYSVNMSVKCAIRIEAVILAFVLGAAAPAPLVTTLRRIHGETRRVVDLLAGDFDP